jgi:thiamine biosynthesis lipoprotein
LEINLSPIAKSCDADVVAKLIKAHALPDYLMEIGGEIQIAGN